MDLPSLTYQKRRRSLVLLSMSLLALVLTVVLIIGLSYRNEAIQPVTIAAQPTLALTTVPLVLSTVAAPTVPSPTQVTAPAVQDAASILALVNGEPITEERYWQILAVDEAITSLFGLSLGSAQERLERMINTELVMQHARTAGFAVAEDEVASTVTALLLRHQRTPAELDSALEARSVDLAVLNDYLRRTLTADRFLAQVEDPAALLAQLQQTARISLGSGLTLITSASTPPAPPTPESTVLAQPPILRGLAPGNLLPDFSLPLLATEETLHADDLVGQPTVLSFFTTWCPYCRQQTPLLVEAAQKYTPQGIRFIGIDVKEDSATVENYVDTYQIPYPIGLDSGEVAAAYAVNGYPTTYFLDAQGRIYAHHIGALTVDPLDRYLADLLATSDQED